MLPIDSQRLRFRSPSLPNDLPTIFRLQSDPLAMQYIRPPDNDVDSVKARVLEWLEYGSRNPGLGVWLVYLRDGGEFAGYCVLREAEWKQGNDLEIGYAIVPEMWGKGLATELAQALCNYAFGTFDVDFLVAFIDPLNTASGRVLEKCGFEVLEAVDNQGLDSLKFRLNRSAFR